MPITVVPPFAAPPDFPVLSDRAAGTYNSKAFAWATAWQSATGPNVYAMADTAYLNAVAASASATTAQQALVEVTTASGQALAASNFKGNWSGLTGALAKPACVKHSGRFWLLMNDLANVAASEPSGGNPDWTANDAGVTPTQVLSTAGATVAAVTGVLYLLAANNIVLNAPAASIKGDYHGIRRMAGVTGCTWVWGATKVRGGTPGTLSLDIVEQDLFYEDATRGYV